MPKISDILRNYNENSFVTINDVLEFYNVTQIIDAQLSMPTWSKEETVDIAIISKAVKNDIFKYYSQLDSYLVVKLLDNVDIHYIRDYWSLLEKTKTYERLTTNEMSQMISHKYSSWFLLLSYREIVNFFCETFRSSMLKDCMVAECIIDKYIINDEKSATQIHLPRTLDNHDKLLIINKYISSNNASIRILDAIKDAPSNRGLKIDDKTRLKAAKASIAMQNDLIKQKGAEVLSFNYSVSFEDNIKEVYKHCFTDNSVSLVYSQKWITDNLDYPTLLNNFIYLFDYVNLQMCSNLVSKSHEKTFLEAIEGKSPKNHYSFGSVFLTKNNISILQLNAYYDILRYNNISIEGIIHWFFTEYLNQEFNIHDYKISMPEYRASYLEKCKSLHVEMQSVLKQFQCYVEEGFIDHELLSISSGTSPFSKFQSLVENKYVYPKSDKLLRIIDMVFSSQSPLAYYPKCNENNNSFYKHLVNDNVNISNYPKIDSSEIEYLAKEGYIFIDSSGIIHIQNIDKLSILRDFFLDSVSTFYHQTPTRRAIIKELISTGDVTIENTLFTKPEQDYLNFILNKSEFANGYDLRNRYAHGTYGWNDSSDRMHKNNFFKLLSIFILIIIKINDELCLKDDLSKNNELLIT